MSITGSRIRKIKEKRGKRATKTIVGLSSLAVVTTLGLGAIVVKQYYDTNNWKKDVINNVYADMPPEFAKNHIPADMIDDINSLSVVGKNLDIAKKNNGLTRDTIKSANEALKKSQSILGKYNITSGQLVENQKDIEFFIRVYNLEESAYENFNTEELQNLLTDSSKKIIESNQDIYKTIYNRLSTIATDYGTLSNFLDTYIPKLGTIDGNVITLNKTMSASLTQEMVQQIDDKNLTKFPNVLHFKNLMTSPKWSDIMENNKNLQVKASWDITKQAFESLTKNQYVKASSISNYKDAVDNGLGIDGITAKPGYIAKTDSPVKAIYVNGTKVKQNQYIKKGSYAVALINPIYEKDPDYVEPSSSSSSSSTSSSSSSWESNSSTITSSTYSGNNSSYNYPSSSSQTETRTSTSSSSSRPLIIYTD